MGRLPKHISEGKSEIETSEDLKLINGFVRGIIILSINIFDYFSSFVNYCYCQGRGIFSSISKCMNGANGHQGVVETFSKIHPCQHFDFVTFLVFFFFFGKLSNIYDYYF